MHKKAAVITVNYNGLEFLPEYFKAINSQTYTNFDIYFVDNNSKDDSVKYISENYPKTHILKLKNNLGFSGGNNVAIKTALKDPEVEFIVLINNDTIVDTRWLEGLIKSVDYSKKIEMISSLSLFKDGRVQTIGNKFEKNLIGDTIGGLSIGFGESQDQYTVSMEIFCPSGVSVLYTRNLIEKVGMFDEDFFLYFEDFDLGYRARKKGFKAIFSPDSKLIHLHSSSSGGRASDLKSFYIKRNSLYIAIKHFPIIDLILYPLRDFFWMVKNFLNRNNDCSTEILKRKVGIKGMIIIEIKAYWQAIIHSPKLLKKRFKEKIDYVETEFL